jgi:hypothetical protein
MKRMFVTVITLIVVMFSSPVFASLSAGTWTSSSGAIRTGTWALTTYGNLSDTGILDSHSYPTGLGLFWDYPGAAVSTISWYNIPIENSSDYYRAFQGSFSGGKYPFSFNFIDDNIYTITNTTGSFGVLLRYDSDNVFLGSESAFYLCEGIIDQENHKYAMTITSTPDVDGIIGPFIVGTVDNIEWNIQAVPIPASLWIFGAGLLGLIGLRVRTSQQSA